MKNIKIEKQNTSHWSSYWKAGQLTSLPQDFQENYIGEIEIEWNKCFHNLKDNNFVLDLCAGNCAISLLARQYAQINNIKLNIHALDSAEISKKNIINTFPEQKNNLEKITIYSKTKVEESGLESNSFDLITSQYGIEYCEWEAAAAEVFRLLKPNGEFVMITHSGSTEIVKYMQIEKDDYQMLFSSGLFKYIVRFSNNKLTHKELMLKLKIIQPKIVEKYKQTPTQLLQSILTYLDKIYVTPKNQIIHYKTELMSYCQQHKFAFERMNDLLRVIKNILENPEWYRIFERKGLQLLENKVILQNQKNNSGHLYRFRKP